MSINKLLDNSNVLLFFTHLVKVGERKRMTRLRHFLSSSLVMLSVMILQCDSSQPSNIGEKTVDKSLPADSGIINVKNYGAKGDGTTDDTQAIETAIKSNTRGYGQQKTIYR